MREQTIQWIDEFRVIAIMRGITGDDILKTAEALYRGGVRLMEITFDRSGVFPAETTCDAIARVAKEYEGRVLVGAGTVTTIENVEMAHRAGARFLISPNLNKEIIRRTVELGMVSMPGALTPSEIMDAHDAGADYVKVFPAGNMGTGYIKAVRAPISDIKLMAVGGITPANAADYIKAGCKGIGMGGNLANREWINSGEFDKIEQAAREIVAAVRGD